MEVRSFEAWVEEQIPSFRDMDRGIHRAMEGDVFRPMSKSLNALRRDAR